MQAEEALRAQIERLTALNEIDRILAAAADLPTAMHGVLERSRKVVECRGAAIYSLNAATYKFDCLAKIGELRTDRRRSILPRPDHVAPGQNFGPHGNATSIRLVAKGQEVGLFRFEREEGKSSTASEVDFLEAVAAVVAMAIDADRLRQRIESANEELHDAYQATLEGWSRSLDARDRETEGHSQRVTTISLALARRLGYPEDGLLDFRRGALLHDIGKIGIPDFVLHKRGPLTDDEWLIMRAHPEIARGMLAEIGFLSRALDIPYCHHEKWDGTGYPRGLSGRAIPWAARIFAVVDVFDALTSDRPYRKAWTREAALAYIEAESGGHFDPAVVAEFLLMLADQLP